MRGGILLLMRWRRSRQAAPGHAEALRHQPVGGGRSARRLGDGWFRGRCEIVRPLGRAPGGRQESDRRPRLRTCLRRGRTEGPVPGDIRVRCEHALPRQGQEAGDVHAGGICRVHLRSHRPHRTCHCSVLRISGGQGARSTRSRLTRGRPHGRLHGPQSRRTRAHRHPPCLRWHSDGRHHRCRVPPDRHGPSRDVPGSGEEGRAGYRHLLAVLGRLHEGRDIGYARE